MQYYGHIYNPRRTKMDLFKEELSRHIEMMASAYIKATDIPIEECVLIVETLPDKLIYRFEKRKNK